MNLEIQWNAPLSLVNGHEEDLIFSIPEIDEWDGYPGIYMFCRMYAGSLIPLYIGRSKNIGLRVKQHLNTTKMMKAIQKAPNGEKVLVVGEFISKSGQSIDLSLKLIERVLIDHALAKGHELINKAGTKKPIHTINFNGFKAAKDFTEAVMYSKVNH